VREKIFSAQIIMRAFLEKKQCYTRNWEFSPKDEVGGRHKKWVDARRLQGHK